MERAIRSFKTIKYISGLSRSEFRFVSIMVGVICGGGGGEGGGRELAI